MTRDFLIIGGGIAGVAAAAELSRLGAVTLLETEPVLAHHASSRSAALFEPSYGLPPVVALSHASGPALKAAGVLSPRGLMIVARADQRAAFVTETEGMGLAEITTEAAIARVPVLNPETLAFAALADHAWDIDTDRLIQTYARDARSRGAEIVTAAPVTAITRTDAGWHVVTPKGDYTATRLVNAAGPWADQVAGMAGVRPKGFTPYRRSMARIPAPGGHDPALWPMIFGAGESWYAKPDAGALIVSPAEEHAMTPHDAWPDDMVLAEGLARYEEMVTEPVTRLLASWAGLRTFAPDRVLVIGPDVGDPTLLWSAGQGGYGFQTAPAAAALLAALADGRAPDLDPAAVAALSATRFA
ncbi:MAG: FAD-dependent oxidoreductase [Rhodobacteraceae bacterium]|nr:FAD-dependent oxidoreductase [Paracoccaceae bacterium]